MKKILRIVLYVIMGAFCLLILFVAGTLMHVRSKASKAVKQSYQYLTPEAPFRTADDGFQYRDLNKNGKLDIYEDSRRSPDERTEDLLSQMTLEEKTGCMFITMIGMGKDGNLMEKPTLSDPFSFALPPTSEMVLARRMNHFNIYTSMDPRLMAIWYNRLQKLAERTRLGIPVTIASDPRNAYTRNFLAGAPAGSFSQWCEPIGLAAIGDTFLTWKHADIARQEYLAVGIRVALHPMADLATEPRWPRINGTFGEDAALASRMVYAYVKGFQGDSIGPWSVACMTKHFSGGGPQKEGLDPHFQFTKGQVYPGNNFRYHLIPFEAAFKAGTAEIMPYYGIPVGQTTEDVGMGFNKDIITGLLRNTYHFNGIVCTDWGLLTDSKAFGMTILPARAHGMIDKTVEERMLKVIEAGVDQFGGEAIPEVLAKLVKDGKISEARIDSSVRRLLIMKFQLGLFDQPFVDVEKASEIVGNKEFRKWAELSQRRAITLLKNDTAEGGYILPLKGKLKIYIRNINPAVASRYAEVVDDPKKADIAVIRLDAPYEPRKGFLEQMFHHGDLDFKGKQKEEILRLLNKVPTIVDIYLDRPAVIPEIAADAVALLADFGANDEAVMDVVFGKSRPEGNLPFELPSSMDAVRNQKEDVPYDSEKPLFPFGFGLRYR
ncbi:MAG TPA: glycoside hydrolase family 3 N-terminal domain-containing protein [Bacteroidales bacterium]|nr:glycoside hydrolase family 3 N-terminal domain-containing protein [Bacteroidales bacterium]